jgi:hypothetical protein
MERFGAEGQCMRMIDTEKLLLALWDAVEGAGAKPSANKVQKMARLAGASFDDKAARVIMVNAGKNLGEES